MLAVHNESVTVQDQQIIHTKYIYSWQINLLLWFLLFTIQLCNAKTAVVFLFFFFCLILIVESCMKQNLEHQKDTEGGEDVQ